MHGPAFRECHLLLDEHARQLFRMTDVIAERAHERGGETMRSIGGTCQAQRLKDHDKRVSEPSAMYVHRRDDGVVVRQDLSATRVMYDEASDGAAASLSEV